MHTLKFGAIMREISKIPKERDNLTASIIAQFFLGVIQLYSKFRVD